MRRDEMTIDERTHNTRLWENSLDYINGADSIDRYVDRFGGTIASSNFPPKSGSFKNEPEMYKRVYKQFLHMMEHHYVQLELS